MAKKQSAPFDGAFSTACTEDRQMPLIPLHAPGMAGPGPDFVAAVETVVGDPPPMPSTKKSKETAAEWDEYHDAATAYQKRFDAVLLTLYKRALYDPNFSLKVRVKGATVATPFVPGHRWGYDVHGPSWRCKVMVIGKQVGEAEAATKYNFSGKSANELYRAFNEISLKEEDYAEWYTTSVVRHPRVDPSTDTISNQLIRNCKPLLQAELRLVRPDYILCLGTEAAKAVLGRAVTVVSMVGKVEEVEIPITDDDGNPAIHRAKLMVATNPGNVFRRPQYYSGMLSSIAQFNRLRKDEPIGAEETDLRHICLYNTRQLARIVDEIISESNGVDVIAVDAEWHGKMPGEPGSYLRTIQFSHKAKHAFCVVLRRQGGESAFSGGTAAAAKQLNRLLKSTPAREVRVGGQFFRADLPWLLHAGIDLRDEFKAPTRWSKGREHGGWDTGYMAHAYREAADTFKLEVIASWMVGYPRYDGPLQAWKTWYCARHRMKDAELAGYGECPDCVLHPYALHDADSTRRLFDVLNGVAGAPGLLDADEYGNSSRRAVWMSQIASPAFLEMEMTGVSIDRVRADEITKTFVEAKETLEKHFREMIGWPDFNPNSSYQIRDLLFGSKYNGKRSDDGRPVKLRPAGARSLGLTPIKSTGKKGKIWPDIVAAGEEALNNPSTDKETLGILFNALYTEDGGLDAKGKPLRVLGTAGRIVRELRDVKFLGQVLKGMLRKPMEDDGGDLLYDDEGNLLYDGGLIKHVDYDGRVRTNFYPVETGRCSSSRPNLQNISKRRESDYARILGSIKDGKATGDYLDVFGAPLYKYKIRSMVAAAPGTVLIESDFKMAEMAMLGWCAGDTTMIEHVRLNTLPESHPDFLDLHSQTAITAFHLDTPDNRAKAAAKGVAWKASKSLLIVLGLESLRVAAKNVNFGVPYQRSAEAIARQCREEGVFVSVEESQTLIDNYYATYPQIAEFLDECKQRARHPGWLVGPYGRNRRFQRTSDREVQAEMERQACNFPIQNGVAEAINVACKNLMRYRENHDGPETFRMCLQIHDALLFEVPIPYVEWFVETVLPACMKYGVKIRPRALDGSKVELEAPYNLDIDFEVFTHWGDHISAAEGLALGVPAKYCTA